jgi:hypothetical protein
MKKIFLENLIIIIALFITSSIFTYQYFKYDSLLNKSLVNINVEHGYSHIKHITKIIENSCQRLRIYIDGFTKSMTLNELKKIDKLKSDITSPLIILKENDNVSLYRNIDDKLLQLEKIIDNDFITMPTLRRKLYYLNESEFLLVIKESVFNNHHIIAGKIYDSNTLEHLSMDVGYSLSMLYYKEFCEVESDLCAKLFSNKKAVVNYNIGTVGFVLLDDTILLHFQFHGHLSKFIKEIKSDIGFILIYTFIITISLFVFFNKLLISNIKKQISDAVYNLTVNHDIGLIRDVIIIMGNKSLIHHIYDFSEYVEKIRK